MPASSQFVIEMKRIERLIDAHARSGAGLHKRAVPLRAALVNTLTDLKLDTPVVAGDLRRIKYGWKAFLNRHSGRIAQVALGVFFITRREYTRKRAGNIVYVPAGDIAYVTGLIERAGMTLEEVGRALEANAQIPAAADGHLENLVVSMDERALEDMLLAAVESYKVYTGGKGAKYKECYGWCLGYETRSPPRGHDKRFDTTLRVVRIATQMRAKAGASYVIPNDKSAHVHRQVAARFFPHLQLVGDYHTHPFKTAARMRKQSGWKYSKDDENHIADWVQDVRREGWNPRISIIVAIAEGAKSARAMIREAANRWKIGGIENLQLVVTAYRILRDGTYDDQLTLKLSYLGGGSS